MNSKTHSDTNEELAAAGEKLPKAQKRKRGEPPFVEETMKEQAMDQEPPDQDGQESVFLPKAGAPDETDKRSPQPTPEVGAGKRTVPGQHTPERTASPDSGDGRSPLKEQASRDKFNDTGDHPVPRRDDQDKADPKAGDSVARP